MGRAIPLLAQVQILGAQLSIALDSPVSRGQVWWVRLVGLYNQRRYISKFGGSPAQALLDVPRADSYLVSVLSTDGYECIGRVHLVEQTRRWTFRKSSCSFELNRYAHSVELPATADYRQNVWYVEMRKDRP